MIIDTPTTPARPAIPLFWSAAPFVVMLGVLGIGSGVYHFPVAVLLLASAAVTGVIARAHGLRWARMEEGIVAKLATSMPASLIVTAVGALIGSWMFSGTIPMMIYYGIQVIHPDWIVLSSFLIASVVSSATGTSWGSVGTVGVALIGIAASLGVPLPITAGAIVAGAYFGDKMSPMSDSTNLAALVTGANLYEHIRHLMYTTMPVYLVSIGLYIVLGQSAGGAYTQPAGVKATLGALESMYTFGWTSVLLLVPVVVVVAGSIMKLPTVPTMLCSSALALALGIGVQHFSLAHGVSALVDGFGVHMAQAKLAALGLPGAPPDVVRLLTRGGMTDMMSTLLIVFCAFGFAGIVSSAGMLDTLLRAVTDRVALKRGPLILSTVLSCVVIGLTTGASFLCLIIPAEMFGPAYRKAGLHPVNLSRTVEDAGTVLVPLVPWSMAGIYMSTQLGVPVIEYAPYAFLCYGCMMLAVFYGYTGIAIRGAAVAPDGAAAAVPKEVLARPVSPFST
ncbi:MAG: Na+/H+ antiporter NhaC [Pseudomonadota bacterium]